MKTLQLLVKRRWLLQWREEDNISQKFPFTPFWSRTCVNTSFFYESKIYDNLQTTFIVGQKKVAQRRQHFLEVFFHTCWLKTCANTCFPILKQKHDETPGREQTPIEIRNQRTGVRNVKGCGLRHMTFLSSLLLCLSCLLRKHYSIHTLSRGNHTLQCHIIWFHTFENTQ